jgi:hypothetical protein
MLGDLKNPVLCTKLALLTLNWVLVNGFLNKTFKFDFSLQFLFNLLDSLVAGTLFRPYVINKNLGKQR